jgi:methionine synthase II (cobalamin-independent)
MDTLVDDIGSFPLPTGVKRETYAKAYELARQAILRGQDITRDEYLQKNFVEVVVESFRKKLTTGLDVANFPQHYSGIRQVGDAIHEAMETGSFVVEQDRAFLPEIHVINQHAKLLSEEYGKKILLRVAIFGPIEQYLAEVGPTAYPDVLEGFAETINRFAKNSILNTKYIETKVVSIDEPSLGHSTFTGSPELVRETLEKAGFEFVSADVTMIPQTYTELTDPEAVENMEKLIERLEDHDDVQNVWHNWDEE